MGKKKGLKKAYGNLIQVNKPASNQSVPNAIVCKPDVSIPIQTANVNKDCMPALKPILPKQFNNQQKKKWLKFQAKLKLKEKNKNMLWTKKSQPGTPDTIQNAEGNQGAPLTVPFYTASFTTATSQESQIPILEPNTKPKNITLKTKHSQQQEIVKQRLNWIKSDGNTSISSPGSSSAPEMANQDPPPLLETPHIPLIFVPNVPKTETHMPLLNQRITAGSFFRPAMPQTHSAPIPRGVDLCAFRYPKGVPKSFLLHQQMDLDPGGQPITADSPIWPNNNVTVTAAPGYPAIQTLSTSRTPPDGGNPATSPLFVDTDNQPNVRQQYSPSDIYSESINPEPPEDDSTETSQGSQKRLSAFQRLGPLSQPKKPKLTINLNLNKEQPVREVVNETDSDPDKYTPVHLRQDIIMSTDETVMKYLTSWPWRKNVGVRKTATARNSRSAMILEKEQMEEAYDKNNCFIQITVKGYPSTWTKEKVLDALLDNVKDYSFIPCFTEFYQNECKFLVLRSRSALIVLHKSGFYIHKDGVELTVTISLTDLTLNQIDYIPRIILRKRMVMNYNAHNLNLSAFTLQEDISHFIYFPLNRVCNQSEFIQLQSAVDWGQLTQLDLSHNRLTTISGFDLQHVTPRLKHLNLAHNYLEKISEVLNDRLLPLKTLHLEGNPLCHDYTDPEHYIRVIRMMFPGIVEIDGVPVQRRGDLPSSKQNYCPKEAMEVAEKFLEIFFPLLDSGSDSKSLVQGMYEDDAILTVTYNYKLRYGPLFRCFRNLFLFARALEEGETDSVVGAMAITKLINRWPQTEHDPLTFTVDVIYHSESTTILRINGIFKLTVETLAEDEHLLAFTRTIVLHSEDGAEYKIHNEMVYWDEPSAAAAREAFRVNTIAQKKCNLKIESTTDEDLRDKFLKIFMNFTAMDKKTSERCLEINNWNFKLALEHFTKLVKTNNLDSLIQEEPDQEPLPN